MSYLYPTGVHFQRDDPHFFEKIQGQAMFYGLSVQDVYLHPNEIEEWRRAELTTYIDYLNKATSLDLPTDFAWGINKGGHFGLFVVRKK